MLSFQRAGRQLSLLILSLCILSLIAAGGAAGADTLADEQLERNVLAEESEFSEEDQELLDKQEREKLHEEEDTPEDRKNSSLITASSATTEDGQLSPETHTTGTQVGVAVAPPNGQSFGSNATVDIWLGAFNSSNGPIRGVPNEQLNVTISAPSGDELSTETVQTDANGSSYLSFDLQNYDAGGEYEILVEGSDNTATLNFHVGPRVEIMPDTYDDFLVNDQSHLAILVRDGLDGASGVPVNVTITNSSNDIVHEETLETNASGITELTFTPAEAEDYTIEVDAQFESGTYGTREYVEARQTAVLQPYYPRGAVGEETIYTATLVDSNGPVANEDVTVNVTTEDGGLITTKQVTTNQGGAFLTEYTLPESTFDLQVEDPVVDIEYNGEVIHTDDLYPEGIGGSLTVESVSPDSANVTVSGTMDGVQEAFLYVENQNSGVNETFVVENSEFERTIPAADLGGFESFDSIEAGLYTAPVDSLTYSNQIASASTGVTGTQLSVSRITELDTQVDVFVELDTTDAFLVVENLDQNQEETFQVNATGEFTASADALGGFNGSDVIRTVLYESDQRETVIDELNQTVEQTRPLVSIDDVDVGDTLGYDDTGPGGEVTINVSAAEGIQYGSSEPLANEDVRIYVDWGNYDSPPFFQTTVTTDAEGQASTTLTVPQNALDKVYPDVQASLEYDGQITTDSARFEFDIQEYAISLEGPDYSNRPKPGDQFDITFTAQETVTGDPVEGIPVQYVGAYDHPHPKADAASWPSQYGEMVTNSTGEATATVEAPLDVIDNEDIVYYAQDGNYGRNEYINIDHNGILTIDSARETDWGRPIVAPGEEVEVVFDSETDAVAHGVVTGTNYDQSYDQVVGTLVNSSANATVTIPESAEDGDYIYFEVLAVDGDGEYYSDYSSVDVEQPEGPTASFDVVASDLTNEPTVDQNLTFDASASTSSIGDLNYTWDFGDGTQTTVTDAVTEYSYAQPGEYTVELTVTNSDGQTASTTQTITVRETTAITGMLTRSDGQPAANDTVVGVNPDASLTGSTVTDDNGTFELAVPKPLNGTTDNATINVGYFQGDLTPLLKHNQNITEVDIFPRDGNVDMHTLAGVNATRSTYDVGSVQLPVGHVLNTTVVELGDPIAEAGLVHEHGIKAKNASVVWNQPTDQNGQGISGDQPGLELNGTVSVAAFAPNSFSGEPDAARTLNVTEDTEIVLDIEGTPPTAELTAPERVTTGESFELDASDSSDESDLESFTFTIYNESGGEVFSQQSPASEPVVTTSLDATGNYTAELKVVDLSGQTNTTTADIEVREGKNLAASVDVPTEQRIDELLEATVTVENVGTGEINETITVDVNASGTTYDTEESITLSDQFTIVGLDEGNATTETITFDLTTDRLVGEVDVDVTADSDDAIDEVSEESNVDSDSVEITYANLDATINAPDVARTGEDTTLRSYVTNLGTAASDNTTANITVTNAANGSVVYTNEIQIGALTPDDRARNTVGTSFNQTGTYTIAIDVDDQLFPEGASAETNISIEAYDLTVADDASDVPAELDAERNTTVVFGFETNARDTVEATLDLSGTDAVAFPDGSQTDTVSVDPEADRTNIVPYEIKADSSTAENVELTFSVEDTLSSVNESDSVVKSTSVVVPTERVRTESATTIDSGNISNAIVELQAYGDNVTDSQELEVSLQGGTEGRTLQGLGYLANYPYGCVEQTTSAFLGALNIDEYYDNRTEDVTDSQQDTINGSIEKGLERLKEGGIRGQQPDGSWNQWGRSGQEGQSFFTSYALLGTASVANNDKHSQLNNQSLSEIRFNDAVDWVSDDNWDQPDGYLYDSVASTGFTLISLDEVEATSRLNESTQQTLDEIYANASLELLEKINESVDTGVAWDGGYDDSTGPNPRSTALAVHGLQLALDADAHEVDENLNESDLKTAIDDGAAWLLANQNDDGSWDPYLDSAWYNDIGDKSETTSAALLALNETGLDSGLANESIVAGTDYLIDVYEQGGSWGYPRATQASIDALNELTDEGGARTVAVTVTGSDGTEENLGEYTVNATNQQETITISGSQLENVLHQEGTDTLQVEIETVSDDGLTIVAGTITQQVEVTAIEGDSQ